MDKFQIENIKQGIINQIKSSLGLLEEEIEKLAKARMEICNVCPNKSEMGVCKLCGCVLAMKTKALNSTCDDKKW